MVLRGEGSLVGLCRGLGGEELGVISRRGAEAEAAVRVFEESSSLSGIDSKVAGASSSSRYIGRFCDSSGRRAFVEGFVKSFVEGFDRGAVSKASPSFSF